MESGVSPWPVVETTKITASSSDNKLCVQATNIAFNFQTSIAKEIATSISIQTPTVHDTRMKSHIKLQPFQSLNFYTLIILAPDFGKLSF